MQISAEFSRCISRVRELMIEPARIEAGSLGEAGFNRLALDLFELQFRSIPLYQRFCAARDRSPANVASWEEIPALPASAFKGYSLTSLPEPERRVVFQSSGTTRLDRSRHFHDEESLELYRDSVRSWFQAHLLPELDPAKRIEMLLLAPPANQAPDSSLVCMFETVRGRWGTDRSTFSGEATPEGWVLDFEKTLRQVERAGSAGAPLLLLGTAFSFLQLFDEMGRRAARLPLPAGSRILETGGYKGRTREIAPSEWLELAQANLGVPPEYIISEYGMSELSSQAYNGTAGRPKTNPPAFRFPPWARARVISPETGEAVQAGQTGLIRVFDLANVRSVLAVQTEDLGLARELGIELLGRDPAAVVKGCSLMQL